MRGFQKVMMVVMALLMITFDATAQNGWVQGVGKTHTDGNAKITKVGIRTDNPQSSLHVAAGDEASLAGNGYLQLGDDPKFGQLLLDTNEVMARQNGKASTLHLNPEGGRVQIHSQMEDGANVVIEDDGDMVLGGRGFARARLDLRLDEPGAFVNFGTPTNDSLAAFHYSIFGFAMVVDGQTAFLFNTAPGIPDEERFRVPSMAVTDQLKAGHVETNSIQTDELHIGNWTIDTPDYVFQEDYDLRSLEEVESFINGNSHLPGVPSAADMKRDGLDLAQFSMTLLEKVEEQTLYTLAQQKEIENLKQQISGKE